MAARCRRTPTGSWRSAATVESRAGLLRPGVVDVLTLRGERIASVTGVRLRPRSSRASACRPSCRLGSGQRAASIAGMSRHSDQRALVTGRHVGHRRGDRHAPAEEGAGVVFTGRDEDAGRGRGSGHGRGTSCAPTRATADAVMASVGGRRWSGSAASTSSCSTPASCARRCSRRRPTSSGTPSSSTNFVAPVSLRPRGAAGPARDDGFDHPRRLRRRRVGRDADRRLFGLEARPDHAHAHARGGGRARRRSRECGLSRRHGARHGHDGRRAASRCPTPPTGRARRSGGSCTPVTSRRRSRSWPATRPARSRASTCSSTAACALRCAPTRSRAGSVVMARSALVTGGTGGIGSAIVRRLRADGYDVVFCGRDEARGAALEQATGAIFRRADATDRAACDASVAFALERLGRVDLLVANAGVLARGAAGRDERRGVRATGGDEPHLDVPLRAGALRPDAAAGQRRHGAGRVRLGHPRARTHPGLLGGQGRRGRDRRVARRRGRGLRHPRQRRLPGQHAARDGGRRSGALAPDCERGVRDGSRRGGVGGLPRLGRGGAHQRRDACASTARRAPPCSP